MKALRKLLIKLKIWEKLFPPTTIFGCSIHRDWPWVEKKRFVKEDDIVSVQPMMVDETQPEWMEYVHHEDICVEIVCEVEPKKKEEGK